jgi:DNA-binding GntR family transcriptional regulator
MHEFLEGILQSFNIISFSYQVISSEGLVRKPEITIGEHLAIIEAICRRDPDNAETLMRRHFTQSIAALRETRGDKATIK